MKKIELFTKEELEKLTNAYGFIYEPDNTKCKMGYSIPIMWSTFYVRNGVVEYGQPGYVGEESGNEDWVLMYIPIKYINDIYVDVFDQEDQNKLNDWNKNYHGHIWVKASGHTPFTEEERLQRRNDFTKKGWL